MGEGHVGVVQEMLLVGKTRRRGDNSVSILAVEVQIPVAVPPIRPVRDEWGYPPFTVTARGNPPLPMQIRRWFRANGSHQHKSPQHSLPRASPLSHPSFPLTQQQRTMDSLHYAGIYALPPGSQEQSSRVPEIAT